MPEGAELCLAGGFQGGRRCGIWMALGQTCAFSPPPGIPSQCSAREGALLPRGSSQGSRRGLWPGHPQGRSVAGGQKEEVVTFCVFLRTVR